MTQRGRTKLPDEATECMQLTGTEAAKAHPLTIRKLGRLTGLTLRATDGELGELREVYFDDEDWVVRYLVVHTGSWLLGRDVLIAPRSLKGVSEQALEVDLTRAQVEGSPPADTKKPVSRHYETSYYRYYGWEPYWMSASAAEFALPPRPVGPLPAQDLPHRGETSGQPPNPTLRSSKEVVGYHIHARDGTIGHVEDLLIEDQGWKVRYLEVDTRNWWPGRKALVAPAWIERVGFSEREIFVSLERDAIRNAPEYDPSSPIGPDDEIRLFEHYSTARRQRD